MGIHKWIGSVPDEWPTAALWILGQRTNDKNYGLKEKNLLSLSYGNVIRKDIKDKTGLTPASYETYQIVEPGDVIFRFTDLQNDHRSLRSALVTERGIMTSAYINFRPDSSRVHPDFIAYFMRAMDQAKVFYEMGTGVRQTLNYEEFSRLEVPVPPLPTQRAIADYLDRETAEIDGMRADLDEMERLLTERRAAVIGNLRTSVPSKHCPISVAADVTLGKMVQPRPNTDCDKKRPYVHAANIRPDGRLDLEHSHKLMYFNPKEFSYYSIQEYDVLIVEGGKVGQPAYVTNDIDGYGFQNSILRLRPYTQKSFGRYLYYAMLEAVTSGRVEVSVDSVSIPHFTAEKVSRFRIPLPSLAEQRRIADEIDRETAEIDSMLEDITKLRDLLAERRAAVISAAVTGRICIPVSPTHEDEPHA